MLCLIPHVSLYDSPPTRVCGPRLWKVTFHTIGLSYGMDAATGTSPMKQAIAFIGLPVNTWLKAHSNGGEKGSKGETSQHHKPWSYQVWVLNLSSVPLWESRGEKNWTRLRKGDCAYFPIIGLPTSVPSLTRRRRWVPLPFRCNC